MQQTFIVSFHIYNHRECYLTTIKLSNASRERIRVTYQSTKRKKRPIFFNKFISFGKFCYIKNTTEFMTEYSENAFHLNDFHFVFQRSAFSRN